MLRLENIHHDQNGLLSLRMENVALIQHRNSHKSSVASPVQRFACCQRRIWVVGKRRLCSRPDYFYLLLVRFPSLVCLLSVLPHFLFVFGRFFCSTEPLADWFVYLFGLQLSDEGPIRSSSTQKPHLQVCLMLMLPDAACGWRRLFVQRSVFMLTFECVCTWSEKGITHMFALQKESGCMWQSIRVTIEFDS